MCLYTMVIVLPSLSGLFIKVVCARETFLSYLPNKKKKETDCSGKRFSNTTGKTIPICTKKILSLTNHKVWK